MVLLELIIDHLRNKRGNQPAKLKEVKGQEAKSVTKSWQNKHVKIIATISGENN